MKFVGTSGMATSSLNTPIDRINMGVKVHVLCFSNAYRYFCYKGKGFTMELVTMYQQNRYQKSGLCTFLMGSHWVLTFLNQSASTSLSHKLGIFVVSVFRVIDTILKLHVFSLTCLFNIFCAPHWQTPCHVGCMWSPQEHGLPQAPSAVCHSWR